MATEEFADQLAAVEAAGAERERAPFGQIEADHFPLDFFDQGFALAVFLNVLQQAQKRKTPQPLSIVVRAETCQLGLIPPALQGYEGEHFHTQEDAQWRTSNLAPRCRGTDKTAEFARRAEELGFDYLGCGEHVMFHGPVGNTFISLSVAAGATQKIKLISSIVLLPLYPAALVAKMGSALDVASNGRYNFGVGIGGEFPKEFEACGRAGQAAWLADQ